MSTNPLALQLFTVRDALAQDLAGTLRRVKEIGYDAVELACVVEEADVRQYKTVMDDIGLKAMGNLVFYELVTGQTEAVIEQARLLGLPYVIIPWLGGEQMCPDKDAWLRCIDALDEAGAAFHDAGIRLCYHNHYHEFEKLDGQYILEVIFERTQPEHLAAEIDTFWVKYAGLDPVVWITKYAGRCPLIHLKDMLPGDTPHFAELGRGIIEWDPVLDAARQAGADWFIVEQDQCDGDPFESIRISAEFMAKKS